MTRTRPRVAVISMQGESHVRRCLGVAAELIRVGAEVVVLSHADAAELAAGIGAAFEDLYAGGRSLIAEDEATWPNFLRWVTFAGRYIDEVLEELRRIDPQLIVVDQFAPIGRAAAEILGLPWINLCAGHNVSSRRGPEMLAAIPHRISERLLAAVDHLRELGVADASPLMLQCAHSPHLNLYCEPPRYLTEAERAEFEPVEFYGSLLDAEAPGGADPFPDGGNALRVYVSFGTVGWRYYLDEMASAVAAAAEAIAAWPGGSGLITLGGWPLHPDISRAFERPGVRVADRVDQRAALRHADVFLTHHGLSSTHESIAAQVPMVSYPLWWDQPGLAARCQEFGLALPLAAAARAPIEPADVRRVLNEIRDRREVMAAALAEAREWELETVARRGGIARRILQLTDTG